MQDSSWTCCLQNYRNSSRSLRNTDTDLEIPGFATFYKYCSFQNRGVNVWDKISTKIIKNLKQATLKHLSNQFFNFSFLARISYFRLSLLFNCMTGADPGKKLTVAFYVIFCHALLRQGNAPTVKIEVLTLFLFQNMFTKGHITNILIIIIYNNNNSNNIIVSLFKNNYSRAKQLKDKQWLSLLNFNLNLYYEISKSYSFKFYLAGFQNLDIAYSRPNGHRREVESTYYRTVLTIYIFIIECITLYKKC